jgi:hypothetical protein
MDASNINSGIISPEEARDRLKSDPDSGYTNLVGNAPEPEEPEMPTTDPEGDASREHESSEADKNREHEMLQAGVAAAAAKKEPAIPIKAKTKD